MPWMHCQLLTICVSATAMVGFGGIGVHAEILLEDNGQLIKGSHGHPHLKAVFAFFLATNELLNAQ